MVDTDEPGATDGTGTGTTNRRTVLKAAGAATAGVTGLAATAGSAGAWSHELDVIEVDLGGFFTGPSADGDLPVVDELLVFVHGWFGDTTVESQAGDVADSLEAGGYQPDATVALEWPATTINFGGAESDTEDVGEVAADLAADFYDAGGGNVRLVGHSLGGRCVLWAADKLADGYELETVAPMGAAADGSTVCPGGIWYEGIQEGASEVRNYHSENDSIVGTAYGGLGDTALGNEGANCAGAATYTDVDVSDSVGGHLDFLGDQGVGDDLAGAILDDDGGGGGDGGDDDFCLFFC